MGIEVRREMGTCWSKKGKGNKPELGEPRKRLSESQGAFSSSQDSHPVAHQVDDHQKPPMAQNQLQKDHAEGKPDPKSIFVPARQLSITWSEDQRYWSWLLFKSPESNEETEVAYLLNVCWLEVRGKFDASKLSRGTAYEILFDVTLKDQAYGWAFPVNLKLVGPDGKIQERTEKLMDIPRERWMELHVGDISTANENSGPVEYSLYEYGGHWKGGLMLKGAIIRPKT